MDKNDYDNWCWNRKYEIDLYGTMKQEEMKVIKNIENANNQVIHSINDNIEPKISNLAASGIVAVGIGLMLKIAFH